MIQWRVGWGCKGFGLSTTQGWSLCLVMKKKLSKVIGLGLLQYYYHDRAGSRRMASRSPLWREVTRYWWKALVHNSNIRRVIWTSAVLNRCFVFKVTYGWIVFYNEKLILSLSNSLATIQNLLRSLSSKRVQVLMCLTSSILFINFTVIIFLYKRCTQKNFTPS